MDVFVDQLQRKDSALLAAYALATCLKHGELDGVIGLAWLRIALADMKDSIKENELLPKYIVLMLRLDYFDDAVGKVEGFQIFGDFMQHGNELLQSFSTI